MAETTQARLAQSVERQTFNLMVVGSSPTSGILKTIISNTLMKLSTNFIKINLSEGFLPGVDKTQNYDELQRRVEKSNSLFQQKLIKSNNEKWYEKKVKVNKHKL